MQNLMKHANNGGLIVGSICLSLLGVFGFAANRVLRVVKGRKVVRMSRHAMTCAPSGGAGVGLAPKTDNQSDFRKKLKLAAQKAAEQAKKANAFIERNTFAEESVSEESSDYPLDVVV